MGSTVGGDSGFAYPYYFPARELHRRVPTGNGAAPYTYSRLPHTLSFDSEVTLMQNTNGSAPHDVKH